MVSSVQKILIGAIIRSQAQSLEVALIMDFDTLKACLLQRKVKVCRAADILIAVHRVVAVCLIQCRGAFLIGIIHLALVRKEMAEPVILSTIFIDGLLDASGNRNLVVQLDDLFSTFDDPRQNAFTGIIKQVLTVIFDVALAGDFRIERNDDQATPDTIIGRTDTRQVVGVQHQRVARLEGERVFILFLRKHIIGGAELLDGGIVQAGAFLHFCCNEQTLAFDLGHFRFDISAASNSQRVCGDIAAVKAQHTRDRIPEGGLTVSAIAVGNNQRFHINLADSSQTANHLHIVNQGLVTLENQVQTVQPDLLTFLARRYRGDFSDEVLR